jgi:hypothetical protein
LFHLPAQSQQSRIPLQVISDRIIEDPGETAVVQLIAAVQRQLQVLAVRVGLFDVDCADLGTARRVSAAAEGGEHGGGQRAARLRKRRLRYRLLFTGTQHLVAVKYRYRAPCGGSIV